MSPSMVSACLTPPDFDSLLYFAADGVPIDVEISPDGIVGAVANWDSIKSDLKARALEKAGSDEALRQTAEDFFASLTPVAAAEIFARPLALSAAGRIVKLEAPARRSVDAKGIAIPSFTSNAKGNWTFSLVDAPSKNRLPGAVTVEWLGVPNAEDLRAILKTVAAQFSEIEPDNAPALAVIERDARMWQRFLVELRSEDRSAPGNVRPDGTRRRTDPAQGGDRGGRQAGLGRPAPARYFCGPLSPISRSARKTLA